MEIRDSQVLDIDELVSNVRPADLLEAGRLGLDLRENMRLTLHRAIYKKTAIEDGKILAMWGVIGYLFSDYGVPYLLTSTYIEDLPVREFIKIYRDEVRSMTAIFPCLENVVDSEYTGAVRLLRLAGFTLSEPMPVGVNGEMFQKFSIRQN